MFGRRKPQDEEKRPLMAPENVGPDVYTLADDPPAPPKPARDV